MKILKSVIMTIALLLSTTLSAQNITSVHGTLSDDMGPLMGATVCEIDATGRIIESALTDLNGNFTMKIRNTKDKIRFSYVGLQTVTMPINKTTYVLMMKSKTKLKEVTVTSKRRMQGNSLPIPQREISYATQTISMKEFEGLGIPLSMRPCRDVLPVWILSVTLVTWVLVLPCVCVVLRQSLR
jgi:hypothetical protein